MDLARQRVLGTAGHIDHGKSALVRALTGVDTDRLPEEKRRGITIDLGFSSLDLGGNRLSLIDVPGHERFVRNMLAGATGLDLALLVVAADDSVMPQTREHLEILRLLGLSGGLIAVTKCDLMDPEWIAMVEDEVRGLVRGSFLEGAPIVRTSAATGAGIDELRARLGSLAEEAPVRSDPGKFRMAIDRAFTVAGHGTVVTGTVASGAVQVGDELEWLPEARPVRVRGLQQHGHSVESLGRGTRTAINLVGVHHTEVRRGQELGAPGYLRPTQRISAEVRVSPDAPRPLRDRTRYRFHLGTAEVVATIALLESRCIDPGQVGLAQLSLAVPVAAVYGEPFVLRTESPPTTIGGGTVLQPIALRIRRRNVHEVSRLGRMRGSDPLGRVEVALTTMGLSAWTSTDLIRDAGLTEDEATSAIERLAAAGTLIELTLSGRRSIRLPGERVADLESRVLVAVGRLHEARPRQSTIRRTHITAALPDILNEALIAALIDRLLASGELVGDSRAIALSNFKPRLSHAESKLKSAIAAAYRSGWLAPPDVAELTAQAGSRASILPELMALLVDEGCLVELSPGFYLDSDAEADLRRRITERLSDGSSISMSGLRDLLGVTRKHAVPYGEHLDRIGLTRREDDARRLASTCSDDGSSEAPISKSP